MLDFDRNQELQEGKATVLERPPYIDKGVKHTITKTVRKHGREVEGSGPTYKANTTVKELRLAEPEANRTEFRTAHAEGNALTYIETITKHGHKTKKTINKTLTAKFKVC